MTIFLLISLALFVLGLGALFFILTYKDPVNRHGTSGFMGAMMILAMIVSAIAIVGFVGIVISSLYLVTH